MATCGKIPLVVAKWMWKAGEKKTMEGCVMSQRRPSQHRRGKHTLSSLMTSPELGSVEGDMVCISRRGGGRLKSSDEWTSFACTVIIFIEHSCILKGQLALSTAPYFPKVTPGYTFMLPAWQL